MNRNSQTDDFLTSRQAADLVEVTAASINNWVKSGALRAHRTPGGHRRIPRAELARFALIQGMPLPDELKKLVAFRLVWVDDSAERRAEVEEVVTGLDGAHVVRVAPSVADGLIAVGDANADTLILDESATDIPREIAATAAKRFNPTVRVIYVNGSVSPPDASTAECPEIEFTALRWASVAAIVERVCNSPAKD